MSKFANDRINALDAYVPGEQPKERQYIKLNTNESPYMPSPMICENLVTEASNLNLYPQPEGMALINKIADMLEVRPENVILGNGSDEILNFAFLSFCSDKKGLAFPDVTYGFYKVMCELYGIPYTEIPTDSGFNIDLTDYYNLDKNIVIANPNAPSGIYLETEKLEEVIKANPENVVIIDEAYVDFGNESAVYLTKKYDNVLVTRTFSKSRSLAGARLGFAIGSEKLISDMNKVKFSTNPYNINRLTQLIGLAVLENDGYYMNCCREIVKTREKTVEDLRNIGFITIPTGTNFIFAKHPALTGEDIYKKLKDTGILVRYFGTEKTKDYVRITVGTPEQMMALTFALKKILEGKR